MSARRAAAGAAIAAFLLVATPGVANAEPTSTIEQVSVNDGELRFVVALNDVPAGAEIDTDSVTASLDGEPLDPAVELASENNDLTQTALLVMDTSNSMNEGGKLDTAKEAATQF